MKKLHIHLDILPALWIASIPFGPSVASIFLVLALISIAINPNSYKTFQKQIKTSWFVCLGILCLWMLSTLAWLPQWNHESLAHLKKILRFAFIPFFMPSLSQEKNQNIAINGFIIGMIMTCLLSMLKWSLHLNWYGDEDPGHLFYNHIITGFLCVFAAYCCLEECLKNHAHKWLYALGFILLSIEILMINPGRAAYILYAVLWANIIWKKTMPKQRLLALLIGLLGFVLLFQVSPILQERFQDIFQDINQLHQGQQSTSLGFRWQFYQFAYQLFQKHPFIGNGLGSYAYYFQKINPVPSWQGPPNPHNQYALILVELGLVGLFLILILFYQWWKAMNAMGRFFIVLLAMNSISDVILHAAPGQLFLGIAALSLSGVAERKVVKDHKTLFDTNLHPLKLGD